MKKNIEKFENCMLKNVFIHLMYFKKVRLIEYVGLNLSKTARINCRGREHFDWSFY